MSYSYSQMLILQDSKHFIPLHKPLNVQKKSIKMKRHSLKLTSSDRKPNKLILYEKKSLQRSQVNRRHSHRYNHQILLSLINKTNEILKSRTLSKVKIQQKTKKDPQRSEISSKVYTRAASPQMINSTFYTRLDASFCPQFNFITKNSKTKQDISEKPEVQLKNMMQESIKKRTPRTQVKFDIQTRQNTHRMPISNIRSKYNNSHRQKNIKKNLYSPPKRPTTSHSPCPKRQQKQIRVISQALQPW